MTITDTQAMQILVDRKLSLRRLDSGEYVCLLSGGLDVRVRSTPMPTPNEAIEVADVFLSQRELARTEKVMKDILLEQQRGEYFHRPREVQEVDPVTSEVVTVTVFDIRKSSDNSLTEVRDRKSLFKAWADTLDLIRATQSQQSEVTPGRVR